MGIEQIADIQVSATQPGLTQAGFGTALLVSPLVNWVERIRTYTGAAGVLADTAATRAEYLAAVKLFGQTPAPTSMKIGRAALVPTLKYTIKPLAVANATTYSVRVRVGGTTVDEVRTTAASDSSATNEEIVDLLVTAINGTTSNNFTAVKTGSGGSAVCDVTGDNAGDWFAIESLDLAKLTVTCTHADPGIATDLAAIQLESPDWYCLLGFYPSYAQLLAAAAWAEANEKLHIAATPDTLGFTDVYSSGTTTDLAAKIKAAGYARTAILCHPAGDDFADAAYAGRFLPLTPGSETWRLKTLAGVTAKTPTATHITNLEAKNAGYYYSLGNISVVGGKAMVGAGEYIDVVRFRDWWKSRVQTDLANLLIQNNKIPFTDAGIGQVEAVIRAVIKEGIAAGGIAESPAPTVSFPKASSVSSVNKAARNLSPGTVTFTLAGAIHKVAVTATISL